MVPRTLPLRLIMALTLSILRSGEVVTYARCIETEKPFLSIYYDERRRAWVYFAAKKLEEHNCDALTILTSTYRYIKALIDTPLKTQRYQSILFSMALVRVKT